MTTALRMKATFECFNGHRFERVVWEEHGVLVPADIMCSVCGWGGRLLSARRLEPTEEP